ncbi:hypothetical protein Y032_0777g2279 [Ancylostoma ceylanicum]|uniref:Uncharacterized protein n=1 Tax=Ancylostoma ceylanicum TaxID=53326 RepID=A0A016WEB1_9BILA|nr:hypothetical protein Y032_0777g2279 [Ancylostoma ceylanicum]
MSDVLSVHLWIYTRKNFQPCFFFKLPVSVQFSSQASRYICSGHVSNAVHPARDSYTHNQTNPVLQSNIDSLRLLTLRCLYDNLNHPNQSYFAWLAFHGSQPDHPKMRPIVSCVGGPSDRISWFLNKIVSQLLNKVPAHIYYPTRAISSTACEAQSLNRTTLTNH